MDTMLFVPPKADFGRRNPKSDEDAPSKKNLGIVFCVAVVLAIIATASAVVESDSGVALIFVFPISLCSSILYFIPSLVGSKKNNFTAIFMLNLLAGWTFIGWVGALVWACVKDKNEGGTSVK